MFKSLIVVALLTFATLTNANAQIVALGASNTAGYGVGAAAAFPAQLQEMLRANGRPMSVTAPGVSGDTTAGMLARLSSAVPNGTKIVVLQIGGNDRSKGTVPLSPPRTAPKSASNSRRAAFAPLRRTVTLCQHSKAG